jgi:DNA-binding GntR family transcriptional regulator
VASPSVDEARQVLPCAACWRPSSRAPSCAPPRPRIQALREHVAREQAAVARQDVADRTELLGDFHVRMAELMGNEVLAQVLRELLARCAIVTLMYQSTTAAHDSSSEHAALVECFAAGDVAQAVRLMRAHLDHVEAGLNLEQPVPTFDIRRRWPALRPAPQKPESRGRTA